MVNVERASAECLLRFRNQFEDNYKEVTNGTASPITCFCNSFPRMCVNSREQKKPMLILVVKESTPECFRQALTALASADAATELISEKFLFAGFSLAQPPIEQFSMMINLGAAQAVLYFGVVQHDAKV